MEGLIFGGDYLRKEICVSKSIGLAFWLEVNFFLLCICGQFSKYKPPGGLYLEGRFNGGFFALRVWEAYIWRGLYKNGLILGNFTVSFDIQVFPSQEKYICGLFGERNVGILAGGQDQT